MSESLRSQPEFYDEPALATLHSVRKSLYEWTKNPTDNDPMIADFAGVAWELSWNEPRFAFLIERMIHTRNAQKKPNDPFLDADYTRNLLLRDFQFQFISLDHLTRAGKLIPGQEPFYYPHPSFRTREGMREGMLRVLNERLEELAGNLFYEKIVSNISDRYKASKIVLPRFAYRLGDIPIRGLDIGPSIGIGPKKWLLNEPFSPVSATYEGIDDEDLNRRLTEGINANIQRPTQFERVVGFDTKVSQNQVVRAKAHSFYPGEYYEYSKPHDPIKSPNRLDEFNRLAEKEVPGYEVFQGDFTDRMDIERFKAENPNLRFHMISFYTVAYMFSEVEVAAALEHAKGLLEPEGIIFIADRVKADPTSPNGLKFGGQWNSKWLYGGVVIDPSEGGIPDDWFRWKTPRCKELLWLKHN